jgi:hypothetical protein
MRTGSRVRPQEREPGKRRIFALVGPFLMNDGKNLNSLCCTGMKFQVFAGIDEDRAFILCASISSGAFGLP